MCQRTKLNKSLWPKKGEGSLSRIVPDTTNGQLANNLAVGDLGEQNSEDDDAKEEKDAKDRKDTKEEWIPHPTLRAGYGRAVLPHTSYEVQEGQRVLTVGDGDFSFSCALLRFLFWGAAFRKTPRFDMHCVFCHLRKPEGALRAHPAGAAAVRARRIPAEGY